MDPTDQTWKNLRELPRRTYQCGHCGATTGSIHGYITNQTPGATIYMCGGCNQPTYFTELRQVPSPIAGNPVDKLPIEIHQLYEEARKCTSLGAYTACVLCCRKMLMHIAVECGAKAGESFLSYVEFLAEKGYVPPNGSIWVDHIRKRGNEANHEIGLMSQDDAQELINFLEMLLKFIYEFPARINPDDEDDKGEEE